MSLDRNRSEACHNCRRRRLKCDRSLPQCLKCIKTGQECLGYRRLLRWGQGVASRGKMMGKTFEEVVKARAKSEKSSVSSSSSESPSSQELSVGSAAVSPIGSLADPLVQDLGHVMRKYLFYFASDVCKDLVLYDTPEHNPFRELIPLTFEHPVLLQVIVANSALHMSNSCQRSLVLDKSDFPPPIRTSLLGSSCSSSVVTQKPTSYYDALAAKQQGLQLLCSTLPNMNSANIDVVLAVVLLFIEFELIDSGRNNWRHHIHGARTIIETWCGSGISTQDTMSSLRRCLISNCMVFDILGSTLACSIHNGSGDEFPNSAISLLQDEQGNHCSSFPTILLQLVRTGTQLSQPDHSSSCLRSSVELKQRQLLTLLHKAQSFDAPTWATDIQPHSPTNDLADRTNVALAHRAAVCIYLSRIYLSFDSNPHLSDNLEPLVAEIITHVSLIHPNNPLFKAIAWPVFIAGAETHDRATQDWVFMKLQELWAVEPWGLIQGALGVLERIWEERRNGSNGVGQQKLQDGKKRNSNWVADLRRSGVDWLVI